MENIVIDWTISMKDGEEYHFDDDKEGLLDKLEDLDLSDIEQVFSKEWIINGDEYEEGWVELYYDCHTEKNILDELNEDSKPMKKLNIKQLNEELEKFLSIRESSSEIYDEIAYDLRNEQTEGEIDDDTSWACTCYITGREGNDTSITELPEACRKETLLAIANQVELGNLNDYIEVLFIPKSLGDKMSVEAILRELPDNIQYIGKNEYVWQIRFTVDIDELSSVDESVMNEISDLSADLSNKLRHAQTTVAARDSEIAKKDLIKSNRKNRKKAFDNYVEKEKDFDKSIIKAQKSDELMRKRQTRKQQKEQ